MAKTSQYKCTKCGDVQAKWAGKCFNCDEWGTYEETTVAAAPTASGKGNRAAKVATGNTSRPVNSIAKETKTFERLKTGINEFDRVLNGIVPGSVTLLAGPPGAGKSSLALWVAGILATQGKTVLYITGEETENQVAERAVRIGATSSEEGSNLGANLYLLAEGNLQNALAEAHNRKPDFLVVDSIQTLLSGDSEARIGSIAQATEVATEFTNYAKQSNVPTLMIGHMTKNDSVAGANAVQHLVDTVLVFEANHDTPLRMLRAQKHRYGSADEIGVFQHAEHGLEEVADPSNLFMDEHAPGTTGFAITMTSEGKRIFPMEVQALVSATRLPNPRKISQGFEHGRSLQIQAVIEKAKLGLRLFDQDVYVASVGGMKVTDPGVDLAVAAALISSQQSIPLTASMCFMGEVTLTGEIRSPKERDKKLREAARMFDTVFTTPGKTYPGANIIQVKTVYELAVHLKNIKASTPKVQELFVQESLDAEQPVNS